MATTRKGKPIPGPITREHPTLYMMLGGLCAVKPLRVPIAIRAFLDGLFRQESI